VRPGGDSLIRGDNLEKAIASVKSKTGAPVEVLELRLEPKEAKFQVRDGDGARGWAYTSGGELDHFKVKLVGPGRIEDNVFPIDRLDAGAPGRVVAGVHAKAPRYELKDVQFMTLDIDPASGKFNWSVNVGEPGSGNLYEADLDGSDVRAPGEAGRDAADCIGKAAGDPAKVQACVQ
jgi:SH3-like domain-containing protein